MRDMLVFDWLFEYHKKESFLGCNRKETSSVNGSHDVFHSDGLYNNYSNDDYSQPDFDDDLDSDMYDDDF